MANRYPLIVDTTIKELASGDTLVADNLTLSGTTPTLIISATGVLNIPTGTTAQRPGDEPLGSFRYNTTDGSFEGCSATGWGEIGGGGANLTTNNYTGDGSTAFTLGIDPSVEQNTFVYIDGVYQFKNTYSTSGTTLTFSTAPPTGAAIEVMSMTATNSIVGTVSDNAITTAKIEDNAVNGDKLADNIDIAGTLDVTGLLTADASVAVTGNVDILAQGDLRLQDASGGQYAALQAPTTIASSYTLTLPADDGDADQYLQTNGSGVLDWATVSVPASAYNTWLEKVENGYTALDGDQIICNAPTTAFTIDLPSGTDVGRTVTLSNIGAATVTVGRGGQKINSTESDATLLYNRSTQLVYVNTTIGWKEIP